MDHLWAGLGISNLKRYQLWVGPGSFKLKRVPAFHNLTCAPPRPPGGIPQPYLLPSPSHLALWRHKARLSAPRHMTIKNERQGSVGGMGEAAQYMYIHIHIYIYIYRCFCGALDPLCESKPVGALTVRSI